MNKTLCVLLLSFFSLTAQAQWTTVCSGGNGFVVDLAAYGGYTYSTGFFTHDCSLPANYINKWDGTTWSVADTGLPDPGHRICLIGTDMYIAKYQQDVDTNWVYKWDGTHFVKFGAPLYLTTAVKGFSKTPSVYDIVEYHGDIIISGEFDWADGKHISGIARWTGTTWDSLGTGLGGYLSAAPSDVMYPHQMLVYNDTLYVAGNFVTAGGVTANGVAKWDGTQWHTMGAGFENNVYALAVYGGSLYAGGGFTKSGTASMKHIAKWDGMNWVDPGFSVYTSLSGFDEAYVHTLKEINGKLFATGGFTQTCNNIIAWDGTNVSTLGGGTHNYQIEGITAHGSNGILVSGGYNNDSSYVAIYDLTALDIPVCTAADIRVYPVPADNVLHIDNAATGSTVTLYDMPGRQVYRGVAIGAKATIDIRALPRGSYLLRVSGDGQSVTKMVVKQ